MREPLIELAAVARRFRSGERGVTVLRDITLSIYAGEIVAIMGPSGSGKSTLMNILGCLDQPSSGSYRIAGRETRMFSHGELAALRRDHFGFVFQRYRLLPSLSALDNVELPAVYRGVPRSERHSRALELLTRLGLPDRARHFPDQLSGGQQQRVGIARALMNGGDVILADEPTGALDSESGDALLRILLELNERGHTIILVTHDERVAAWAQRVVHIHDGQIVADKTAPRLNPGAQAQPFFPSGHGHAAFPRGAAATFASSVGVAWNTLLSHKLRTSLTMLGVVVGITSVASLMAIGEGVRRDILKQVGNMGTHTIDIYPGKDWGDTETSAIETLVPADLNALRKRPYVDSTTPLISRTGLLRTREGNASALINGIGEDYFRVHGYAFRKGRSFSPDMIERQAQVVVIDPNTERKLFGSLAAPLGKVLLIDDLPCRVVGVTAPNDSAAASNGELRVWVPYTTATVRLFGKPYFDDITVRVKDGQPSQAAEAGIVKLLEQRHGKKDFFTSNVDSILKAVEKANRSLTLLLLLIGAVSLAVGGIGLMNVMLVAVTERTREIGIRMAVGARQADIMWQFLAEAVIICLPAGVMGIVISFVIKIVLTMLESPWQMIFSPTTIASAFLGSMLVGVVFGLLPAVRAARLDPVAALAREGSA
jgi:macrolide transport system ATP-binding/permease protein